MTTISIGNVNIIVADTRSVTIRIEPETIHITDVKPSSTTNPSTNPSTNPPSACCAWRFANDGTLTEADQSPHEKLLTLVSDVCPDLPQESKLTLVKSLLTIKDMNTNDFTTLSSTKLVYPRENYTLKSSLVNPQGCLFRGDVPIDRLKPDTETKPTNGVQDNSHPPTPSAEPVKSAKLNELIATVPTNENMMDIVSQICTELSNYDQQTNGIWALNILKQYIADLRDIQIKKVGYAGFAAPYNFSGDNPYCRANAY